MIERERIGLVEKLRQARDFLGRGVYFTACYRVGELLVDSGCAHTVSALLAALAEGGPVRRIVNTHSHEDHIAGNGPLQARDGAEVLAHPLALPVLADPQRQQPQQLYRRLFWGSPAPSIGRPIGDEVQSERHRFQVIHTPGHSPDHICLFEPAAGWLFVGDAFVGGRDRALRRDSDVWQIIASLRRLAALDAELLFPGSGTVYRRPRQAITEKIAYLEGLGERVLALHRRGLRPRAIYRAIFGRDVWLAWLTQGDFGGLCLVRSFIDHAPGARDVVAHPAPPAERVA